MQEHLPAAAARHPGHRRRRRPDHAPAQPGQIRPDPLGERRGCGGGAAGRRTGQPQQRRATERHQAAVASQGQLLLQKAFVAAIHQMANHRMVRAVGLHQHLPGPFAPAGPAGELEQQLQALLARPQIRAMHQAIGRQHRRQGHPGQVHPLRQHLGTHQHIRLARGEALQQMAMAIPAAGGVLVEAQCPQPFQLRLQLFLHPLGAGPERFEGAGAAVSAALADRLAVVAPVAAQPFLAAATVHRQRDVAVRAEHRLAATAAAQKGAIAAAGHQHHRLLAPFPQGCQPIHQRPADQAPVPFGQFQAHVHHPYRRQRPPADPLRQAHQGRVGGWAAGAAPALEGGGGAAEH